MDLQRSGDAPKVAQSVVRTLVQREPVVVDPQTTLRAVAEILAEEAIGAVVVRRERPSEAPHQYIVGIVSERDVTSPTVARGMDPDTTPVVDVMTAELAHAEPSDTILRVAARMMANEVRHLPVTEGDELVGVISERDVLRGPRASTARAERGVIMARPGSATSQSSRTTTWSASCRRGTSSESWRWTCSRRGDRPRTFLQSRDLSGGFSARASAGGAAVPQPSLRLRAPWTPAGIPRGRQTAGGRANPAPSRPRAEVSAALGPQLRHRDRTDARRNQPTARTAPIALLQ